MIIENTISIIILDEIKNPKKHFNENFTQSWAKTVLLKYHNFLSIKNFDL